MRTRAALTALLLALVPFAAPAAELPDRPAAPKAGLVVEVGFPDAAALLRWHAAGAALVEGLHRDPAAVTAARDALRAAGRRGPVDATLWSGGALPLGDDVVNLLVVNDGAALEPDEVLRVLAPGAVAFLRRGDAWRTLARPRAPALDDWTHFEHDAGRTGVSADTEAGPPRALAWMDGEAWPVYQTFRAPPSGFVAAGGLCFYWDPLLSEPGPRARHDRSRLVCRDAFNGLPRWTIELDSPARATCMIATPDGLILGLSGGRIVRVAAADGRLTPLLDQRIPATLLLAASGVLLAYDESGTLAAVDLQRPRVLWQKRVPPLWHRPDGAVADAEKLYVICRPAADEPLSVVAFNVRTGAEAWRRDVQALQPAAPDKRENLSLVWVDRGILLLSSAPRWYKPKACANHALSTRDGKLLWSFQYPATAHGGRATNALPIGDLIWIKAADWIALDPASGREQRRIGGASERCYPDHATPRYLLSGFMDLVDLQTGTARRWETSRSACASGFFPATGRLYTMPTRCSCFPMLRGYLAFTSKAPAATAAPPDAALERGPAAAGTLAGAAGPLDWPVHRARADRSASTSLALGTSLARRWTASVGSHPTQATVAGKLAFVALPARSEVLALNLDDGSVRWRHAAGGPVDSAPTFSAGRLLFGCADGTVTCLAADDGILAWRRRLATHTRRIVVRGRLESPWPVHGSLLPIGDAVCAVAGRHTWLDGGLELWSLDAATGAVRWRRRLDRTAGTDLADLPVGGSETVYVGANIKLDARSGVPLETGRDRAVWAPRSLLGENAARPACSGNDRAFGRWSLLDRARVRRLDKSWSHPRFAKLPAPRADALAWDARHAAGFCQDFGTGGNRLVLTGLEGAPVWDVPLDPPAQARAVALLLARDLVCVGFEVGRAGRIELRDRESGQVRQRLELPAPPVWDGLSAADGNLLVALESGEIHCFSPGPP
jgi:outer membrane protein assembly factor BamB